MVAPVLSEDNTTTVLFPKGSGAWYGFNSSAIHQGGDMLHIANARLDQLPLYARAGAVIPIAPPIQWTGQLPGGALEVQVYAGQDGKFVLTEDDGETTAYLSGVKRRTL